MPHEGQTANLLSMGAVDFGIIIDGAVVMVEGLLWRSTTRPKKVGMEKFNKLAKLSLFKQYTEMARPFSFRRSSSSPVSSPSRLPESRRQDFSPLAYTLGFALLGALLFTLTFVPRSRAYC